MKENRIVAGIINISDKILFIERVKEPFKGTLIMPGGKVEPGETLDAALDREILEETGLSVKEKRQVGFYDEIVLHNRIATHRHLITLYLVSSYSGSPRESDEGKIVLVGVNELPLVRDSINPSDYRMIERVVFNKAEGYNAKVTVEEVDKRYRILEEIDLS